MSRLLIAVFLFITSVSFCQEIHPKGRFLTDTTKVGMKVEYSLEVRYPFHLNVVFPDSTYNFAPFEYEAKRFFTTKTDTATSLDSVIYTFTTFELDTIQHLKLPVFVISPDDSLAYFAATDSIILSHVVTDLPDSISMADVPLKENTSYIPIHLQFNYPYLIIGIIILSIVVLIIILVFGKRMRRWWRLRRMKKSYANYKNEFSSLIHDSSLSQEIKAQKAMAVWKGYMEKLNRFPYRKLTTKEIYLHEHDEKLRDALKQLDRIIYSGKKPVDETIQPYEELETYTDNQFQKRVEELRHD